MSKSLSPIQAMSLLNDRFGLVIEEVTYNGKQVPEKKWSDAIKWMNEQWKADGTKT